jgi:hypothetical protein
MSNSVLITISVRVPKNAKKYPELRELAGIERLCDYVYQPTRPRIRTNELGVVWSYELLMLL